MVNICEMRREYQNKGVGSTLLSYLISDIKEKKYNEVKVDARETAVSFYEKHGFIVSEGPYLNERLTVLDYKMSYRLTK